MLSVTPGPPVGTIDLLSKTQLICIINQSDQIVIRKFSKKSCPYVFELIPPDWIFEPKKNWPTTIDLSLLEEFKLSFQEEAGPNIDDHQCNLLFSSGIDKIKDTLDKLHPEILCLIAQMPSLDLDALICKALEIDLQLDALDLLNRLENISKLYLESNFSRNEIRWRISIYTMLALPRIQNWETSIDCSDDLLIFSCLFLITTQTDIPHLLTAFLEDGATQKLYVLKKKKDSQLDKELSAPDLSSLMQFVKIIYDFTNDLQDPTFSFTSSMDKFGRNLGMVQMKLSAKEELGFRFPFWNQSADLVYGFSASLLESISFRNACKHFDQLLLDNPLLSHQEAMESYKEFCTPQTLILFYKSWWYGSHQQSTYSIADRIIAWHATELLNGMQLWSLNPQEFMQALRAEVDQSYPYLPFSAQMAERTYFMLHSYRNKKIAVSSP